MIQALCLKSLEVFHQINKLADRFYQLVSFLIGLFKEENLTVPCYKR
jgi:hypothetical protein